MNRIEAIVVIVLGVVLVVSGLALGIGSIGVRVVP